jgi:beta-galactosidase
MVKGDLAGRLEGVAARGGSVVTTFLSGRVDEDDNAFLMDVPGPLGPLMGVRVDEWDARGPDVVNPVLLPGAEVASRLLFELVQPTTAQPVGTYQSDFYAGAPAVTRNAFGSGEGWYVAAGLEQAGVSWVVRQVLARHDLAGPYADVPGLESATRVAPAGGRVFFLLNHNAEPVEVAACHNGTDLLSGDRVESGHPVRLDAFGVLVMSVDAPAVGVGHP